jgi:alanyl-tRNA synthetase
MGPAIGTGRCGQTTGLNPKALTKEQIRQVESLIQEKIEATLPVTTAVMSIDEAKKLGAMALFGEKYGDEVRVLAIGASGKGEIKEAFSKEFCGGTHVSNTGEIGGFTIQKEESPGSHCPSDCPQPSGR